MENVSSTYLAALEDKGLFGVSHKSMVKKSVADMNTMPVWVSMQATEYVIACCEPTPYSTSCNLFFAHCPCLRMG